MSSDPTVDSGDGALFPRRFPAIVLATTTKVGGPWLARCGKEQSRSGSSTFRWSSIRRRAQGIRVRDARQTRPLAGRVQTLQQDFREGSRVGERGKGLRVREGPVRRALRRGFPSRQREGHADDRHSGLRRRERDPDRILRDALLSGPGGQGGEGVRAAARDAEKHPARGHRAGGHPHHAAPRRGGAQRSRADARDAALSGRAPWPGRTRSATAKPQGDGRKRQGDCARQTPGRRHDRAMESRGVQEYLSR